MEILITIIGKSGLKISKSNQKKNTIEHWKSNQSRRKFRRTQSILRPFHYDHFWPGTPVNFWQRVKSFSGLYLLELVFPATVCFTLEAVKPKIDDSVQSPRKRVSVNLNRQFLSVSLSFNISR